MTMTDFAITTTFDITQQQVADLVVTAFEGGSNYWLGDIKPFYAKTADYAEADRYGEDMVTRVFTPSEDDEEYTFDREAINRGLQIMADQYPTHFNDLREDNFDADTADVFLQCALFGEIVYG